MKAALIAMLVLAAVLAARVQYLRTRRELVREQQAVAAQWAQVDAVLEHRSGLLPSLVAAVQGVARRETGVFDQVAGARAVLAAARTPQERIQANQQLDAALARLLVMAENYPPLQSHPSFLQLQDDIAATENRIAVERRKYNEALQRYNTSIELFPGNVVASLSGFARNDAYFKTEPGPAGTTVAPKVPF